jgi:hypothetical protein
MEKCKNLTHTKKASSIKQKPKQMEKKTKKTKQRRSQQAEYKSHISPINQREKQIKEI